MTWKVLNQKQLLPQRGPASLREHKAKAARSAAWPCLHENRVHSCLNFVDSRNNLESTVWYANHLQFACLLFWSLPTLEGNILSSSTLWWFSNCCISLPFEANAVLWVFHEKHLLTCSSAQQILTFWDVTNVIRCSRLQAKTTVTSKSV